MSWICKNCETENPDTTEICEVCDLIKDGVRTYSIGQTVAYQRNLKEAYRVKQIGAPLLKTDKNMVFYHSIVSRILEDDVEAYFLIGDCYFEGNKGYLKNHHEAVKWYKEAAVRGYQKAMLKLAQCYEHGSDFYGVYMGGIKKDCKEAIVWYKKLADRGDENALFKIGWLNLPNNKIEPTLKSKACYFRLKLL